MENYDLENLSTYIKESYRIIENKKEAFTYNDGYLQALYNFQIIQWVKQKELREYNYKLFSGRGVK
jgi:hypothetical protein